MFKNVEKWQKNRKTSKNVKKRRKTSKKAKSAKVINMERMTKYVKNGKKKWHKLIKITKNENLMTKEMKKSDKLLNWYLEKKIQTLVELNMWLKLHYAFEFVFFSRFRFFLKKNLIYKIIPLILGWRVAVENLKHVRHVVQATLQEGRWF